VRGVIGPIVFHVRPTDDAGPGAGLRLLAEATIRRSDFGVGAFRDRAGYERCAQDAFTSISILTAIDQASLC